MAHVPTLTNGQMESAEMRANKRHLGKLQLESQLIACGTRTRFTLQSQYRYKGTFWTRSPDEDPKLNSKTPLTGTRLPPPRDSVPSGIFEDPAAHRWGLDPKMLHTANQLRDEYA